MNYRQEYEKWVSSPAITDEERAELRAIACLLYTSDAADE